MKNFEDSDKLDRLKTAISKLLCVLVVAFFVETYRGYFQNEYNLFSNIFYMLGGTFLTANLMSGPIIEFRESLTPFLPRIFRNNKKLDDRINRFNRLKPYINQPETVEKIKKYFKDAEAYLGTSADDIICLTSTMEKIDFVLTLFEPVSSIKIDINHAITQFDDLIIDNKDELIAKILVPFILKINGESDIPINPVYLLGSPGVGKTNFVKRMSEILNIPIIEGDIVDYNCYGYKHARQQDFDVRAVHMYIKALHTAISTKKTRTFIMFIDEFDKKLNKTSNVLEYLTCNNNQIYDNYIAINSDIGNILPICAGNKKISEINKHFVPLQDRFVTIIFPKLTQDIKRTIVYDVMGIPKSSAIDSLINADKFHGIRQLLMKINIYRASLMGQSLFKGTKWEKIIKDQLTAEESSIESEVEAEVETKTTAISRRVRSKIRSKSPAKRR